MSIRNSATYWGNLAAMPHKTLSSLATAPAVAGGCLLLLRITRKARHVGEACRLAMHLVFLVATEIAFFDFCAAER